MKLVLAVLVAGLLTATSALAQVTFYEHDDFRGRAVTVDRAVDNFQRLRFNDLASSMVVRGGYWEICEDAGYQGRCMVLRPGRYPSLGQMDFNDRISSVRRARGYGPGAQEGGRDRQRPNPLPNSGYSQQ
jgi:hypothetical protein